MSQFEFFMTIYGLLLGLGVAELMLGFANLLRSEPRPRAGLLTPLLGAAVFLQAMATFMDAWLKLQNVELNFRGMALPTLIGLCFFVLGIVTVPRDLDKWQNLDDYFWSRRRWTAGLLLACNLFIIGYEIPIVARMVQAGQTGRFAYYAVTNVALLTMILTAMFARPRRIVATALAGMCVFFLYFYGGFSIPIFGQS
jgi:hypothetical protein